MAQPADCQHVILHYIATLLICVGIFTPAWTLDTRLQHKHVRQGLYRRCIDKVCIDITGDPAVKHLVLIGLCFSLFCDMIMTIHCILVFFSITAIAIFPKVSMGAALIGAVALLIGCCVYGFNNFGEKRYPGYSFALVVVCGLLLISAGVASSKA